MYMSEGCMSGHDWHGTSACCVCGERLRCACGRFVREDKFDEHVRTCAVLEKRATAESDRIDQEIWADEIAEARALEQL